MLEAVPAAVKEAGTCTDAAPCWRHHQRDRRTAGLQETTQAAPAAPGASSWRRRCQPPPGPTRWRRRRASTEAAPLPETPAAVPLLEVASAAAPFLQAAPASLEAAGAVMHAAPLPKASGTALLLEAGPGAQEAEGHPWKPRALDGPPHFSAAGTPAWMQMAALEASAALMKSAAVALKASSASRESAGAAALLEALEAVQAVLEAAPAAVFLEGR